MDVRFYFAIQLKGRKKLPLSFRRYILDGRGMTIRVERKKAFLYLLPCFIGLIVFYFIPFIMSLHYSTIESFFNPQFVFIKNYIDLFKNQSFLLALKNTFIFMLYIIPTQIVISFSVAYCAERALRRAGFFSYAVLLPMILPISAFYHLSLILFSHKGIVNSIFMQIGLPDQNWFNSPSVIWVVIFIYLWRFSGFTILLYLYGLQLIPREYYEEAEVEGISAGKRIFSLTLLVLIGKTGKKIFSIKI